MLLKLWTKDVDYSSVKVIKYEGKTVDTGNIIAMQQLLIYSTIDIGPIYTLCHRVLKQYKSGT